MNSTRPASESSASERLDLPDGVRRSLAALEGRLLSVFLLFGVGRILVWICGLLVGLYVLDRFMAPPMAMRIVLLVLAAGWLTVAIWRYLLRPLQRRPEKRDLAAIWERRAPQLGDLFATTVELRVPAADTSTDLLHKVRQQADTAAAALNVREAIPSGRARRSAMSGMSCAGILLLLGFFFPQEARIFLDRLFGGDASWPQDTTLVLLPPHMDGQADPPQLQEVSKDRYRLEVAVGSVLTLRVRAQGVVPKLVTARGGDFTRTMRPLGGGEFVLRLPPLKQELDLGFYGGDDRDGTPRLHLIPGIAPALTDWSVRIEPPAYTRRQPETSQMNEFRIPQGTRLTAKFRSDRPVAKAMSLPIEGDSRDLVQDENGFWTLVVEAMRSGEERIRLEGTDGFTDNRAAILRWHAQPDRAPRLEFVLPGETWTTVGGGQIPVLLEASDDYGLNKILMTSSAEAEPQALAFDSPSSRLRHWELLPAETPAENPEAGSAFVRFRLEAWAQDSAVPQPQETKTESPWIQIVTPEVFEERLGERMVGVRQIVERVIEKLDDLIAANANEEEQDNQLQALSRRLRRDLNGLQQDLESILIERVFTALDNGSVTAIETLTRLYREGSPAPGQVTASLLQSGKTLLDYSGRLLDLSRAALHARQNAAADLDRALRDGADYLPPAQELRVQMETMLDILLAWEDFQSTVNLLRGLLDRQRSLYLRTKEASDR